MQNLVLVIRRQAYNAYHDHPELLDPIFPLFHTTADGEYVMQDVAAATNVRTTTLYSCRERCRIDPQWCPSRDYFCENRRVLSDDIEVTFTDFLRINFVELCRPLTRAILQPLILMFIQDPVAQGILNDAFLNFKCSGPFLSRFSGRTGEHGSQDD
jgi:hypothetical protein